jgi:hypothetical protein
MKLNTTKKIQGIYFGTKLQCQPDFQRMFFWGEGREKSNFKTCIYTGQAKIR